ncbi:MAG: ABC transporter ATP-binding protein [Lachnospiraceae bacterium]|nr:ABC transporter ATP-binding protein [Lachnospiraceae bacterium]
MRYVKIDIRNLSKHYEDTDKKTGSDKSMEPTKVIDNLNLQIYAHEFVCVLGHSGCGKSTLLNLVAGYIKPDEGGIYINEGKEKVTGPSRDRGVVFQEHALFPWYTVEQNIGFGPRIARKSKIEIKEIVDKYINVIGLEEYRKCYPGQLSGGMKQRVGIARAFANAADILLMDEPFSALDEFTRANMQKELLNIWSDSNNTIIFITHSIEEAVLLADRVVVMGNGKILTQKEIMLAREERQAENSGFMEYVNYFKSFIQAS